MHLYRIHSGSKFILTAEINSGELTELI